MTARCPTSSGSARRSALGLRNEVAGFLLAPPLVKPSLGAVIQDLIQGLVLDSVCALGLDIICLRQSDLGCACAAWIYREVVPRCLGRSPMAPCIWSSL